MNPVKSLAIAVCCALSCASCQSYYAVTDLHTHDQYYTRGNLWLMERRYGGLAFQELSTGDQIELQNARAHQLDPREVDTLLRSRQTAASNP